MIPIALDPSVLALAVVGRGDSALRRYRALVDGGAREAVIYSDVPTVEMAQVAGSRLRPTLPDRKDLAVCHVVWIAGLPEEVAGELAAKARKAGTLVNVEDVKPLCDFHSVAEVRRGDLLLTVSSGGQSPALAGYVRRKLEASIEAEWAQRVAALGAQRTEWRAGGRTPEEVARLTEATVKKERWLP